MKLEDLLWRIVLWSWREKGQVKTGEAFGNNRSYRDNSRAEERAEIAAEDFLAIVISEKLAVVEIGQRLAVGAVAFDIGHVGAPDQAIRS